MQDPTAVGTLLGLVAARLGALARYETLARDAALDGKTVKSHLDVLERLFLVRIRRPWHVNLGKRQVKAPKLYVADPGMLGAGTTAPPRLWPRGRPVRDVCATEVERQASGAPSPAISASQPGTGASAR